MPQGSHEEHIGSNPAVETRASARTAATPTHRPGTGGVGQQFEWHITHDVRSRSPEDQPGAEGTMGEDEDSEAKADYLTGRSEADRGGAASTVVEG